MNIEEPIMAKAKGDTKTTADPKPNDGSCEDCGKTDHHDVCFRTLDDDRSGLFCAACEQAARDEQVAHQ